MYEAGTLASCFFALVPHLGKFLEPSHVVEGTSVLPCCKILDDADVSGTWEPSGSDGQCEKQMIPGVFGSFCWGAVRVPARRACAYLT